MMGIRLGGMVVAVLVAGGFGSEIRAASYPPGASPDMMREIDNDRAREQAAQASVLAQLPAPKVAPGELPRPCFAKSLADFKSKMQFASPQAESRWKERHEPEWWESPSALVYAWSVKYLGTSARSQDMLCQDIPFAILKLQEAWGDTPTGIISEREVDRLQAAVEAGRSNFAQQQTQAAQVAEAHERDLLRIFGIALGAPLRVQVCPWLVPSKGHPPAAPVTCYKSASADKAAIYFTKEDQPNWLGYISQWTWKGGYGQPISLLLDLHDWVVTGVHFETSTDKRETAVQALSEKFGMRPIISKPEPRQCVNLYTGVAFDCSAQTTTLMVWNVKDYDVTGICSSANFRCQYVVKSKAAAVEDAARRQQQEAENRKRLLNTGRKF